MKKVVAIICVIGISMLSGCGAIIRVDGTMNANAAKAHPAKQSFVINASKNESFNIALRVMTADGRKTTSSDREAGIVQGEIGDESVSIKLAGKSANETLIDLTVAWNKPMLLGDPNLAGLAQKLKDEIENSVVKHNASAETKNSTSKVKVSHNHKQAKNEQQ